MTTRKHHDERGSAERGSAERGQAEQLQQELEFLRTQVVNELGGLREGRALCTVVGFDPAAATAIQLIVRGEADEALTGVMPVLVDRVTGAVRTELQPFLLTTTQTPEEPAMSVPPDELDDPTTTADESTEPDGPDTGSEEDGKEPEGSTDDDKEPEGSTDDDKEPEDSAEEEEEDEDDEEDDEDDEPSDEDEEDDEDEDEEDEDEDEDEEEDIDDLRAEVARLRKLLDAGGKRCLTRAEAEVLFGELREDLDDDEENEEDDEVDDEDDDTEIVARRRDVRVPRRTYRKLAQGLHTVLTAAVKPVRFDLGEFTLRR